MGKQPRADVFITSGVTLEPYLEAYYMNGRDLIGEITRGVQRGDIIKHNVPTSCCVVVRQIEDEIKYCYSLVYSTSGEKPTEKIRLPTSGFVSLDELANTLGGGLKSIVNIFKTQENKDFIIACEETDYDTVRRTAGNLGYNVVPHYTET